MERQNLPTLAALEAAENFFSQTAQKRHPSEAECPAPPALGGKSPPQKRKAQKKSFRAAQKLSSSEAESLPAPQVRVCIGPALTIQFDYDSSGHDSIQFDSTMHCDAL